MMLSTAWMPMPHDLRAGNHLFVIGDVHGNAHLLAEVRQWISMQEKSEDGKLVFLGDLIDRGHENFETVRLSCKPLAGLETVILPGNHEITLLRFLAGENKMFDRWINMGGATMAQEVHNLDEMVGYKHIRTLLQSHLPDDFEYRLRNGPTHLRNGDFILVHAGVDPQTPDPDAYLGLGMSEGEPSRHWAWIFDEFSDWRGGWEAFGAGAIIHGHQPLLIEGWDHAFRASYGDLVTHRRLNLDFGSGIFNRLGGAEIRGQQIRFFGAN